MVETESRINNKMLIAAKAAVKMPYFVPFNFAIKKLWKVGYFTSVAPG